MPFTLSRPRRALLVIAALALAWLALAAGTPATRAAPAGGVALDLIDFATGLDEPVDIVTAGDERLFVVEQPGVIRIVAPDGTVSATPFLTITDRVCSNGSETGLLGLVFHPDYATNGYFFVNYTARRAANCNSLTTRISRFQVTGDPNVADPASERIILAVDQPYSNHNAGDLAFGPDGFLYIPLGDGGSAGDPQNRSQNGNELLGKLLRIAPSVGAPTEPAYTIPADNPFVGDPNVLDEIWALGLRNPWRLSFDRLTGDLYIGDVGQGAREEINFQPADSAGGENYGWRCYEGTLPYNTAGCGPLSDYDSPVAEYDHSQGIAVTGGFVYRGSDFPNLQGRYFLADYGSGVFWSLVRDGNGRWDLTEAGDFDGGFSTFGEDADGELYVADLFSGTIYRVIDLAPTAVALDGLSAAPTATLPVGALGVGLLAAAGLVALRAARRRGQRA